MMTRELGEASILGLLNLVLGTGRKTPRLEGVLIGEPSSYLGGIVGRVGQVADVGSHLQRNTYKALIKADYALSKP